MSKAWLLLALCAASSSALMDEECASNVLLQTRVTAHRHSQEDIPPWPTKMGNLNHSGYSPFTGPRDVSSPTWFWSEPDRMSRDAFLLASDNATYHILHGSPIADSDLNIYIQSSTKWVYSINKDGQFRWEAPLDSIMSGNMALIGSSIYVCSLEGVLQAFDTTTGKNLWSKKVANGCGADTWSMTPVGDTLLFPCNIKAWNDAICAVSSVDGSTKWTYEVPYPAKATGFNQMHSVVDDTIIFSDVAGNVYRVSLADRSLLWLTPNENGTMSTSGVVLGPNNIAYVGTNYNSGGLWPRGLVKALDIGTGSVLWTRSFDEGVQAAPAVGPLNGRVAVVVNVGNNLACKPTGTLTPIPWHNEVVTLDAATGETIWTFHTPPNYLTNIAGVTDEDPCCPDIWGTPTLAGDGTVYSNWSGGRFFALNDANGDGRVDPEDPNESSSYHHGQGSNSNSIVMPGLTVATTCKGLMGYRS